jgi:hypothetical protein
MSNHSTEEIRKEWEQRIVIYRKSGLTQAQWCEENGLGIHQFKYWLRKIEGPKRSKEAPSKWLPIAVENEETNECNETIEIKIGQAIIEVKQNSDPTLLANVVKVLKTVC